MMTVRPDEAMSQLYPAAPAGDAGGAELELELGARLAVCLDGVAAALRRQHGRLSWDECHLIDIPPAQSSAAGVLTQPDTWGPRQGWAWQVLTVAAVLGPAGTSMSLYRDAAVPTNIVLTSTVSGLFEPSGLYLLPGRFLVWASSGDALTVGTGIAAEIAIDRLPEYLMRRAG